MNILVTGANGFIGKNLVADLNYSTDHDIFKVTRDTTDNELEEYSEKADFVYHLAGVNRPNDESEFMKGNYNFTEKLLGILKEKKSKAPILMSSSIQAEKDNPYGESKRAGEESVFKYNEETGNRVFVYRLPNVFGKWSKPNYNSVVATFCHNIANDLPIIVNDESVNLKLVYIDDVVKEFKNALTHDENISHRFYEVDPVHEVKLGKVEELINSFKVSRKERTIPNMQDDFTKKLYSTYLSYLPEDRFNYDLKMNVDERGSFTEFLKTADRGQVSVNVSKPGVIKGNHWHHTKNEKFLVVSGKGIIRFRKLNCDNVIEYYVSGEKLEVIDIPTGYTHNIENLGNQDMVTIMWANEMFDPNNPDTFFEEV
ncbi:capsular polysaccharide biosynthesis protein CapF [Salinicoccus roseus]|uniref:capsular polysaccharide biosynthesis protein CapF n=1 Tax=Salinicoccus roseus TaxID=45670 RepID=UPI001CA661DD|nr:capsular polysaccharide biosynthesis protein CapF [Salinicoccus roseus]MBY8908363.1 capsular polysaccharide biosynthesis protein CapF [Salinicoccus roseus]